MAIDKAVDSTVLDGYFEDIADAIREKDGTQNTYTPAQMPTAIENIPSGGGGLDWSAIGYSGEPESIITGYNYAKDILDNWDSTQTNLYNKFINDNKLTFLPLINTSNVKNMKGLCNGCISLLSVSLIDTSNVTTMTNMFFDCPTLKDIPILNTGKVTNFANMFGSCITLTDASLDNILQMCVNSVSYTGTKTLSKIGINSSYYSASRIQALPHYQDFIDAGWTIGY